MWKIDSYNYKRRKSSVVKIGNVNLGGDNPICVQSMANTDTNDIEKSTAQYERVKAAGAELFRFTTQGIKEAKSLKLIHDKIKQKHYDMPIVADVHFNAAVAELNARNVEKVRINPGNYVPAVKRNTSTDYSEEEYRQEYSRIKEKFSVLLDICKANNTALRIGVNHGSLSERMLNRYGNTAEGMVESAMEFLKICLARKFENAVVSMKASNAVMMVEAVRLLAKTMEENEMHFPLHLGVTEAGDGEDGRIKSSVGIGALLADGLGDTIRVSLSEDPEAEIPVAKQMRDYIAGRENHPPILFNSDIDVKKETFTRRKAYSIQNIGGENVPVVLSAKSNHAALAPDYIVENGNIKTKDKSYPTRDAKTLKNNTSTGELEFIQLSYEQLNDEIIRKLKERKNIVVVFQSQHINKTGEMRAFIHTLMANHCETPVILKGIYAESNLESLQVKASVDLGVMFLDGLADGIYIENTGNINSEDIVSLSFGILQAARVRTSKTEFISCPGCGRTLFDLQKAVAKIKQRTSHLTGLKIGVMGCIVNGPGEMADADYGYVGAGRGKISLYKKQECVEKNVPEEEALDKLIHLIKTNDDWFDA